MYYWDDWEDAFNDGTNVEDDDFVKQNHYCSPASHVFEKKIYFQIATDECRKCGLNLYYDGSESSKNYEIYKDYIDWKKKFNGG
jgi:transcription elongation factor Elf1